jgi:hypothetical protein
MIATMAIPDGAFAWERAAELTGDDHAGEQEDDKAEQPPGKGGRSGRLDHRRRPGWSALVGDHHLGAARSAKASDHDVFQAGRAGMVESPAEGGGGLHLFSCRCRGG